MNSKDVGDRSEAMILARLLSNGKKVLMPFGDNLRYDLALDDGGLLVRIQCKTGRLRNGKIAFSACSTYAHRGRPSRNYHGDADFFGVYCPENGECYLVPVGEVGVTVAHLRTEPPKNNQTKNIRMAIDYLIQD